MRLGKSRAFDWCCRNSSAKEVASKTVDPPKPKLEPGEVAHFEAPFVNPPDAATGVVVTFVSP